MPPDVRHPFFAWVYPRIAASVEPLAQPHRIALLSGLRGRVVEVGAGHGLNFPHYPDTVTEVVAIEPERALRAQAVEAARAAAVPITVIDGTAEQLPLADGEVDAAVACLVLCSVRDQAGALSELRRVLRPGGELRFYEHVRAQDARFARYQDVMRPLWKVVGGNCHTNRDTPAAIERAGFTIREMERFRFPPKGPPLPVLPHVLGRASNPT
jgi:ubiquinone/menaquinone biosynthesis C-methylase UbiE